MDEGAVLNIIEGAVSLSGRLASKALQQRLVELVADRIKSAVPELATYKHDLELLKLVCNCVENTVHKRSKLDKKAVAMAILLSLFPLLSDADRALYETNIDALCSTKGCVKKVSFSKKLYRYWFGASKKG